tara:strand:+ start:1221 stop:1628 length:408 start_codon:yes stop_codon:yes gene_type:complete
VKHANYRIPVTLQVVKEDQKSQLELLGPLDHVYMIGEVQACLAGKACAVQGITTLILGLLTADASEELPDVEDGSWEDEYLKGNGEEIYEFAFPESLEGMTFSEAALLLYEQYHCILLAVQVPLRSRQKEEVYLG